MDWLGDATRWIQWLLVGLVAYLASAYYAGTLVDRIEIAVFGLGVLAMLLLFWYYEDELKPDS